MNIRTSITLTFFFLVIVVVTAISLSIYYFSHNYRELDFTRRLKNRAINTAQILTEVTEVNAELLRRMEQNNPASLPNQYIVIFNDDNEELYSSESTTIIPIDKDLLERIREQEEVKYNHENFEVIGFTFKDETTRFTIVAAATDVYGLDALTNLRNVLIITFCISAVLVSVLGYIYAGKVLRPMSKIVNEVGKISEVNLDQRLDEGNRRDELGMLAQTFNRMIARLQAAFESQKNFIANASHEIKTPITVMSGEIEVALLQNRDQDYYVKILRSVLLGLKGLNKLSTQLLMLAQTSTDQPIKNFSLFRIDDILWSVKEELQKAHHNYSIDILFDINLNHESMIINGDEQLMRVAILNLVDNGCKYSEDGHLTINLTSKQPNRITIDFINKGPGIARENLDKIFEPFYRAKSDIRIKGFGIGLSLVNRIIKLHEGTVSVESTPHIETRFTLNLPVRS